MGRPKSRLRLGKRTLIGHVRWAAAQVGLPIKIQRRDAVPRSGPLGGIYTALSRSRADAILFLACDMPFVSPELIRQLIRDFKRHRRPAFITQADEKGFPCILPRDCLPQVSAQLQRKQLSIQRLAEVLKAKSLRIPKAQAAELLNINTDDDLALARKQGHGGG